MSKTTPTFKSSTAQQEYEFWLDQEEINTVPEDKWNEFWLALDESYVALDEYKVSALNLSLKAQAIVDSPIVWSLLGRAYLYQRDHEKAYEYFNKLLEVVSNPYDVRQSAVCLECLNDTGTEAEYDFAISQAKKTDDKEIISEMIASKSLFLSRQKRFDEARKLVDEAIKISPTFEAYKSKLYIYADSNESIGEGLAVAEEALSIYENDSIILYAKARILTGLGRIEEAIALYEQDLATCPEHEKPLNLSRIAEAYFKLGDIDKARESLNAGFKIIEDGVYSVSQLHYNVMVGINDVMNAVGNLQEAIKEDMEFAAEEAEEESSPTGLDKLTIHELEDLLTTFAAFREMAPKFAEARALKKQAKALAASAEVEGHDAAAVSEKLAVSKVFDTARRDSLRSQEIISVAMKQMSSDYLPREEVALTTQTLKAEYQYYITKNADKIYLKHTIKTNRTLNEYYSTLVSTLDEYFISAKASKGGFVEAASGRGIPGSSVLSSLPFGAIISVIDAAVSAVQKVGISNDASRLLNFAGGETIRTAEKIFTKIGIQATREKIDIILSATLNEESGAFSLLGVFRGLKEKFVEARHISPAQKLAVQDAMRLLIAFKSGELSHFTEEEVVMSCVASIVKSETQVSFLQALKQGFALRESGHHEYFPEESTPYGSPGCATYYEDGLGDKHASGVSGVSDVPPTGGAGGATSKKKGFFKLFNHHVDPEFIAECEGNIIGGEYLSITGDSLDMMHG